MKAISTLVILTISLVLNSTAFAKSALRCEGHIERMRSHSIVVIEQQENSYTFRYPELSNQSVTLQRLHTSDRFVTFGFFADGGLGIFYINKKNLMYTYVQTKTITEYSDTRHFNHDNYVGSCELLQGEIEDF
jgi:hypothetical protein